MFHSPKEMHDLSWFPYNLYTTMATQYGMTKRIDIGNILMNTLGIWLERIGNIKIKFKKSPLHPQKRNSKEKKLHPLNLLIADMKVLFWKQSATIFTLYIGGTYWHVVLIFFNLKSFLFLICFFILENHLGFLF